MSAVFTAENCNAKMWIILNAAPASQVPAAKKIISPAAAFFSFGSRCRPRPVNHYRYGKGSCQERLYPVPAFRCWATMRMTVPSRMRRVITH